MLVGIITIIIATIVVFNHQLVWLLAVFPGLYIAYALFITYSKAPKLKQSLHLTGAELQAWKEHHAFFRFPFIARKMAGSLSVLQFISVILAIALVVTGAYWGAIFLLGWLLGLPTPRLNPEASIVPAAQRGNPDAIERLKALESLQTKLKSPDQHTKTTLTNKSNEQIHDKYEGLTQKQITDLNQIKELIDKRGNQPVIAVMAKMPAITKKLLSLRGVEIPITKTHFVGIVSFTGKNVAFTFLDYKMSEDMHQTVLLMTVEEISKVQLNSKGTVMVIGNQKNEEASFVGLIEGTTFNDLAHTISDNLPHLYA